MPVKGAKGLLIPAATLSLQDNQILYRLLTKYLIQIST